jgi:prenyltransferase beta subunit
MLQVARLAPKALGESADLVRDFLQSQWNEDGGFRGRDGVSDLYYTVFGIEGLLALRAELPFERIAGYLRRIGVSDELDFVHLACLARCWAALPSPLRMEAPADAILERIEAYRTSDGGFQADDDADSGSLYGCFMATGAYQDLNRPLPREDLLIACIEALRSDDGGYANLRAMPIGLTPSTAAAATLLRHFGQPPRAELTNWLLARCHPEGGFFATPSAPIPDLLSTATALHALAGLHADISGIQEQCLDFVDSLWTSKGTFHATWADDDVDCEYTYYGLLALGHLSL